MLDLYLEMQKQKRITLQEILYGLHYEVYTVYIVWISLCEVFSQAVTHACMAAYIK